MSPLDVFFSAPPISRTLAAVIFTFSLLLWTGILPLIQFSLSLPSLIQLPPELWRVFTSLLITGRGIGILFDTYFLYVYGAKLEIASPRFSQRADFVTYICFICLVVLLLNAVVIGGTIFASALSLAFVLSSTRDSWDEPMTFIVFKMPSQYLPYFLLLLQLIMCGPHSALVDASGVAAAHIYDLLAGLYPSTGIKRNFIPTPAWVKKMFGTQSVVERPYGTVFTGATGEAAWGLDLSWRRFGEGRRLGGDGESSVESQQSRGLVLAAMGLVAFVVFGGLLGLWFFFNGVPDGWASVIGAVKSSSTTSTFEGSKFLL